MATITFYEIMNRDFTGINIETAEKSLSNFEYDESECYSNQSYEIGEEEAERLIIIFECDTPHQQENPL